MDPSHGPRWRASGFRHVVGEGFLADAFLANWDTAGLDIENIAFDQAGTPSFVSMVVATFNFRAQGLPKTTFGFKWKRPGAEHRRA